MDNTVGLIQNISIQKEPDYYVNSDFIEWVVEKRVQEDILAHFE